MVNANDLQRLEALRAEYSGPGKPFGPGWNVIREAGLEGIALDALADNAGSDDLLKHLRYISDPIAVQNHKIIALLERIAYLLEIQYEVRH